MKKITFLGVFIFMYSILFSQITITIDSNMSIQEAVDQIAASPFKRGTIILQSDQFLSTGCNIPENCDIILSSDGVHSIYKSDTYNSYMISIASGATLTLKAEFPNDSLIFDGQKNLPAHASYNNYASVLLNYGTVNLFDQVKICNNRAGKGAAIYNYTSSNSTCNMYGGWLCNNEASQGGAIHNDMNNYFNLYNGSISHNVADNEGGGIFNFNGTLTVYDGNISYNNAKKGGGLYSPNFIIGGTIENNSASESGGGVYCLGNCTMSNGIISLNESVLGGGVFIFGSFIQRGGTITQNTASIGAGIYHRGSNFEMSGSALIDTNNKVFLNIAYGSFIKTIKISGSLTYNPAAFLDLYLYQNELTVLTSPDSALLDENFQKFKLNNSQYFINHSGKLEFQKSIISLSSNSVSLCPNTDQELDIYTRSSLSTENKTGNIKYVIYEGNQIVSDKNLTLRFYYTHNGINDTTILQNNNPYFFPKPVELSKIDSMSLHLILRAQTSKNYRIVFQLIANNNTIDIPSDYPTVSATDTLQFTSFPQYKYSIDTSICMGSRFEYKEFVWETVTHDTTHLFHYQTIHGCDSTIALYLQAQPLPHIIVNPGDGSIEGDTFAICQGGSYSLKAFPTLANSNDYLWEYGNGKTQRGQTYSTNNANILNQGYFKLTVTQEGCTRSDSLYVKVNEKQGAPSALYKYYVGDSLIVKTNPILYHPDIRVVIKDPTWGNNVPESCELWFRNYYSLNDDDSHWLNWSDYAHGDSVIIESRYVNLGYNYIELKHDTACTKLCGISQKQIEIFHMAPNNSMVQATRDIDENGICLAQDSVRLTQIFVDGFISDNNIYQWQYLYVRSSINGNDTLFKSVWEDLVPDTTFNYNGNSIEGISSLNKISVKKTPDNQIINPGDIIRISVRIATNIPSNSNPFDSVYSPASTFQWRVYQVPSFTTQVSHDSICYSSANQDYSSNIQVKTSYIGTNIFQWSYSKSDSAYTSLSNNKGDNDLFVYTINTDSLQESILSAFYFTNKSDTINFIVTQQSMFSSCPTPSDTITIHVLPDQEIEYLTGNGFFSTCSYSELDSIKMVLGGSAEGAQITWLRAIPEGINFSSDESSASISGTPIEEGRYFFNVITTGKNCLPNIVKGVIEVYKRYDGVETPPQTIVTCEYPYYYPDSAYYVNNPGYGWKFEESSTQLVPLKCKSGCDSIVKIEAIINIPAYNPDFEFSIMAKETTETLEYGECYRTISLKNPLCYHYLIERDLFSIDNITFSNSIHSNFEFTAGQHEVIWTAVDTCGNIATCTQVVTINYPPCGKGYIVEDVESNIYSTVRIGCDCWLAENLDVTSYSNGDECIGYKSYQNNHLNRENFGLLYNWYAAMQLKKGSTQSPSVNELGKIQGICPDGWYLPSENDFRKLTENYSLPELMSNQTASYWLGTSINNLSGFNAVPGGYYDGQVNKFYNLYGNAYFWITDMNNEKPMNCEINYSCPDLIFNVTSKQSGYSVRCIKDMRDYIGIPQILVR